MKNVLITGATGGIGSSILKLFYNNNYNVCVTGTNMNKLNEIEVNYKGKVKCISCNLNEELQIKNLVQQSNEYYGSTDILINNAGITRDNLFLRMKDEEWNNVININLNANFKLTKYILKGMIKSRWGRIVNISSDAAKIGNAGQANYVASKSAIEGLTRTLANEVASRGVTVNCVSPGFVETDILKTIDKKTLQNMLERIPLGRMGTIDEIASAVYFLSSEESAYITGQVLHVNGGLTM